VSTIIDPFRCGSNCDFRALLRKQARGSEADALRAPSSGDERDSSGKIRFRSPEKARD